MIMKMKKRTKILFYHTRLRVFQCTFTSSQLDERKVHLFGFPGEASSCALISLPHTFTAYTFTVYSTVRYKL